MQTHVKYILKVIKRINLDDMPSKEFTTQERAEQYIKNFGFDSNHYYTQIEKVSTEVIKAFKE